MRTELTLAKRSFPGIRVKLVLQLGVIFSTAIFAVIPPVAIAKTEEKHTLMVRIEAPQSDLLTAVERVTQDQIIHGTYSYEKERILYGAHSAAAAGVFGQWKGQGKVFYKVAGQVLSPRFFKDSEDIGTISVRYVVQDAGPNAAILQVDAVFVDARNVRHPSLGNVESSEYAAIQERLKNIQAQRKELELGTALDDPGNAQPAATHVLGSLEPAAGADPPPVAAARVPELRKQIDALRRQVELRVKDEGAQLKSAPFHGAPVLQSLPAETEVLVVVLSPYWYGVETPDGHHGWIHHSQLEPLP